MKLDTLIAFTQASYRNMKSYLLYPIACCLPHLQSSVYDGSSFLLMNKLYRRHSDGTRSLTQF